MIKMTDKLYRIWYEKDVVHYKFGGMTIGSQGVAFQGRTDIQSVRKMVLDWFRANPTTEVAYIQRKSVDYEGENYWWDVEECRKRGNHIYIGKYRMVRDSSPLGGNIRFIPDYRILPDGRRAELGQKSPSPLQEIDKAWAGGKKMVGMR